MAKFHTQPRVYSATQYDAVCELLTQASARYAALKGKYDALEARLQAMQAKATSSSRIMRHFSAPEPPSVMAEVVKVQRARGQRL